MIIWSNLPGAYSLFEFLYKELPVPKYLKKKCTEKKIKLWSIEIISVWR